MPPSLITEFEIPASLHLFILQVHSVLQGEHGEKYAALRWKQELGKGLGRVGEQKLFTFARYLQDLPPLDAFMETLLREVG